MVSSIAPLSTRVMLSEWPTPVSTVNSTSACATPAIAANRYAARAMFDRRSIGSFIIVFGAAVGPTRRSAALSCFRLVVVVVVLHAVHVVAGVQHQADRLAFA